MRVLLATDGSRAADRARDLVARLSWPDATRFSVVCAIEKRNGFVAAPWIVSAASTPAELESELLRHAEVTLDDAVRSLEAPGRTVERSTLIGRPASAIVEEAREWAADLVVVGNRGHGPIASMVLGSVSAEIVDHAPCPVLVVRDPLVESIVLADDGSAGAARAARFLRTWSFAQGLPVDVVAVAEAPIPWSAGMTVGLYDESVESHARDLELAQDGSRVVAERAAEQLRDAGIQATAHVLAGDPAHLIVEFARARPRALIVVGTRGHGGLTRLLLGSVARNVLLHSPGSVLVVRESAGSEGSSAEAAAGP